ncbi:MAG: gamma carbonic anhydrase family protein [Bacteriovoracaceae bacterium]
MAIRNYLEFNPVLEEGVYISPSAEIIGRVHLMANANVWFNSVIRGDVNFIKIGRNVNIQDLCMLHVTEEHALEIGDNTSLGHNVILHGCTIGQGCLIGMGSIILDGAEIGDNSLVAAGSLVSPGKKFPSGSLIKGRPARVERALSKDEISNVSEHFRSYLVYKDQYLKLDHKDS